MRTTIILHRLRIPLRLALWATPLLWSLVLLLAIRGQREEALLHEADALLVQGDAEAARQILSELEGSSWNGSQAAGGLTIARALLDPQQPLDATQVESSTAPADLSPYPVPLMIRTAFERGEFQAAQRLTELAQREGFNTVRLLTAATRIEVGWDARIATQALNLDYPDGAVLAQDTALAHNTAPAHNTGLAQQTVLARNPVLTHNTVLARRLDHHLMTPEEQGGVLLRDRHGRPIGTTADGEMALYDDVRPELIPRAVVDAVADHRPIGSLRLTLDLELSEAALEAFGRYRGSIVLLDPHTGHVLAAVSDRRTWRRGGTPAFEQLREPASIAKLITTTAAWRAGFEPDAELSRMRCRGHERYAGKLLYCPSIAGRLRGLDRALAVSCNVGFANLGVQVGRQGMLKEFRRYGFDSKHNPLVTGQVLQAWGDDRQLADLSIGLEATAVTPLHAALIAAVMAADGIMPEPTILAAEDGRLGLHPRPLPPGEGHRVIDPRWVPELVDAMRAVVRGGTAQRVWPPNNFPVAMKTGTASDPRYGFHVNYIGIGPMPDAKLAFCVRVTDQPTSAKVRYAAQQVTYRLLRNLGAIAEHRGWADDDGTLDLVPYQQLHRLAASRPIPQRPTPASTSSSTITAR